MFNKEVYQRRRDALRSKFKSGLILFPGNTEVPMNYRANTYRFRPDSSFLYFFGLDQPDLFGIIDIDNNTDYLFGNDIDMEDIIWMGNMPTISERAASVAISKSFPLNKISEHIQKAIQQKKEIHFLFPYRGEIQIQMMQLLGMDFDALKKSSSEALAVAITDLRSIKSQEEIVEIEIGLGEIISTRRKCVVYDGSFSLVHIRGHPAEHIGQYVFVSHTIKHQAFTSLVIFISP